jgi:MFS family permease
MNKVGERPSGMRAFYVIWFGQVVSLLGTGMTRFALTLWAWDLTGEATALALVALFSFAPGIIFSPIAGALVDRWNRKLVMMLSDLAAGLATIFMFALSLNGSLEIWHVYGAAAFASAFESFQFPAYSSAITMMVDKTQYARTSAMLGLADAASGILAPIFGVALFTAIELKGVLLFDIISFTFALGTLLFVYIPQPPPTPAGAEGKGSLLTEAAYGFRYIWRRKSLFGLQMVFFAGNFIASMVFVLMAPMILARTGNNKVILAGVEPFLGIGGVVGGLIISTWGGPKRRVTGVLNGWIISGIGVLVLGLGSSAPIWMLGAFLSSVVIALVNASNQAIWQTKTPPDLQGRVFAVRRLLAQIAGPVALIITGPLADHVFEPGLQPDGFLAGTFGGLVGTGAGSGMALMFVIAGILIMFVGITGYAIPIVRNVEDIIPDHGYTPEPASDDQPETERTPQEDETDLDGEPVPAPA